jgi:hypothetical protein
MSYSPHSFSLEGLAYQGHMDNELYNCRTQYIPQSFSFSLVLFLTDDLLVVIYEEAATFLHSY